MSAKRNGYNHDMPTFIPETYGMPIPTEGDKNSLWRHYGLPIQTSYSVLITGGVATPSPGRISPTAGDIAAADDGSGEGGKAWFRGGITYAVTSAESTILEAAGYTIIGPGFGSGFDTGFEIV